MEQFSFIVSVAVDNAMYPVHHARKSVLRSVLISNVKLLVVCHVNLARYVSLLFVVRTN